jgi:alpha-glucosidase
VLTLRQVDPAIAVAENYSAYATAIEQDIVLHYENGTVFRGVVWPGPTVFPDWFNTDTQEFWTNEFSSFFSASDGVDIDALWIDMNEPANFCNFPCSDPAAYAAENDFPPERSPPRASNPRPLPGFPADFQPDTSARRVKRQEQTGSMMGLPGREFLEPPYTIKNGAGSLSNKTVHTDVVHQNGLVEYDTHNLYGTMMSTASQEAMLARRSDVRPLVITRSTFAGAGSKVGHWLGDNLSTWDKYRTSIGQMMDFSALFHIPMVGSDICGFGANTTETLCARWAMLGAFNPFYRNHNGDTSISQEFYRWEAVTQSAIKAIDIRFKMLDYFYTAFHKQTVDGTPSLCPMWFVYPSDTQALDIDLQFFWGDAVLVSPVTQENVTTVDIYLPDDIFYDYNNNFSIVRGNGGVVTLSDIDYQTIPIHIRGGTIIPLRVESANTTTELRKKGFNIVVAPGLDGSASGSLYLDDGNSIDQPNTSDITFTYADGTFSMTGTYGYDAGVNVETITILGQTRRPAAITVKGARKPEYTYDSGVVVVHASVPLTDDVEVSVRPEASQGGGKKMSFTA